MFLKHTYTLKRYLSCSGKVLATFEIWTLTSNWFLYIIVDSSQYIPWAIFSQKRLKMKRKTGHLTNVVVLSSECKKESVWSTDLRDIYIIRKVNPLALLWPQYITLSSFALVVEFKVIYFTYHILPYICTPNRSLFLQGGQFFLYIFKKIFEKKC